VYWNAAESVAAAAIVIVTAHVLFVATLLGARTERVIACSRGVDDVTLVAGDAGRSSRSRRAGSSCVGWGPRG